jgi:hypothetical protein
VWAQRLRSKANNELEHNSYHLQAYRRDSQ